MTFVNNTFVALLAAMASTSALAAPLFDNTEQGKAECQEYILGNNGSLYFPKARHRDYGKNHSSTDRQMTLEEAFKLRNVSIAARGVCLNAEVVGGKKWAAVGKDMKVWVTPENKIRTIEACDNPIYTIAIAECEECNRLKASVPAPAPAPTPARLALSEASLPAQAVVRLSEAQLPAVQQQTVQPTQVFAQRIAFEHLGAGTTQAYVTRSTQVTTTVTGAPVFVGYPTPTNPGGGTVTPIPAPRPVNPAPAPAPTPPVFSGGTNPTPTPAPAPAPAPAPTPAPAPAPTPSPPVMNPTPTPPVFGGGTNPTPIPAPRPISTTPAPGTTASIPTPVAPGASSQATPPVFGGGTNTVIYAGTPAPTVPVNQTGGTAGVGSTLPAPITIIAGTPSGAGVTTPATNGVTTSTTVPSFSGGTGSP